MNSHFYDIWQRKTEAKLETWSDGNMQVLSFNDGYGSIELLLTPEQLADLRRTIEWTEAEINEMHQAHGYK